MHYANGFLGCLIAFIVVFVVFVVSVMKCGSVEYSFLISAAATLTWSFLVGRAGFGPTLFAFLFFGGLIVLEHNPFIHAINFLFISS